MVRLRTAEPVRQRQALIHFFPKQLAPFGRHREGTVVQILAEVAEGIADATPVVGAELLAKLLRPQANISQAKPKLKNGSSEIRTQDQSVKSRVLYR